MTASTDGPVGTEFNDVLNTLRTPYEPGRQNRSVSPPQGPLVLLLYEPILIAQMHRIDKTGNGGHPRQRIWED